MKRSALLRARGEPLANTKASDIPLRAMKKQYIQAACIKDTAEGVAHL
jgi:hypothetical protein